MKNYMVWFLALAMAFVMSACGEQQDRISSVGWIGDGEVAVVNFVKSSGDTQTYKIRCKDNRVNAPFDYAWEEDCDLNTVVDGYVQDWDNPEDDRFEDRRGQGSNENYGNYDDDDDDGIDLGDVAIGALIGSSMSKNHKTKVVIVDNTNRKTTAVTKPKPRKTTSSRSRSHSSRRR